MEFIKNSENSAVENRKKEGRREGREGRKETKTIVLNTR
jgi:hypothetical protein